MSFFSTLSLSPSVLDDSSNTVSCPKNGTSVQVLPSESVTSSIPIISVSDIVMVLNFSACPITTEVVFSFPENAFTFFFSKYSAGLPPAIDATVTSVGSYELEKLKSTALSIINSGWPGESDLNLAFSLITNAWSKLGSKSYSAPSAATL